MRSIILGKKIAATAQALVLACGFGAASIATAGVSSGTALAAQASCTTTDPTTAANPIQSGAECGQANGTASNLFAQGGLFQVASNTLIFLVGAVAVVFLIIGGLRYVVSNGDSKAVESAKNTILYAIIGIVVAIISFALVNFVINALSKSS